MPTPTYTQVPFYWVRHNGTQWKVLNTNFTKIGDVTYTQNFPDWKERLKRNENTTTTLDGWLLDQKSEQEFDVLMSKDPIFPGTVAGCKGALLKPTYTLDYMDHSDPVAVSALNEAKRRFLSRLVETQTEFHGLTFLGELRESINMIKNPTKALRASLGSYLSTAKKLKRKIKKKKTLQETIGETYLEYAFGWDPLVSDINEAVEALSELQFLGKYLRADAQYEELVKSESKTIGLHTFGAYDYSLLHTKRAHVTFRGYYSPTFGNPLALEARHLGFSFREILPTAWELLPWSFLVDYFANIGDIVQGFSYGRSGLKWSNYTRHYTDNEFCRSRGVRPNPGWSVIRGQPQHYHALKKKVLRETYNGDFIPDLKFDLPSGKQWVNITALLAAHNKLVPFF